MSDNSPKERIQRVCKNYASNLVNSIETIIQGGKYSKEYIEHLLASEMYGMFILCREIDKGEK